MGPLESKHAKQKRYFDATSEREKKSFLSRLRKSFFQKHTSSRKNDKKCSSASKHTSKKSHRSYLREDHRIDHRKQNNGRRRSRRQSSEEERKKFAKRNRRKKDGLQNSLKKIESNRRRARTQSEAYSTISSSAIREMPALQVQKNRSIQKERVPIKSFRKTLQSWRGISEWSSSSSSRKSIRSAREKIKAFFSRPMQDSSVQKFVKKIKKRNELREQNTLKNVLETPLRRADEKFPSRLQVERNKPQMRTKNDKVVLLKVQKPVSKVSSKANEDKLFDENGLPFWNKFSKVQKYSEKNSEETTDDDLPMDSEVLLDVQAGLHELVKMPKIKIVMDPYASLDYLKSRDKIFFTNEVIFSNTVRSMVNLHDEISNKEIISKRNRRLGKIFIEEPVKVTQYNKDNPLIHEQISV